MVVFTVLPILAGLTVVVVIGLPLLRSYLLHGTIALVRPGSELQRFLYHSFTLTLLGYGLLTILLAIGGPDPLGVYLVAPWVSIAGLIVAAGGLALVVIAQAQMGRSWRIGIDPAPTGLVTHGVFRFSRNPIYLGIVILTVGVALIAPCGWTITGSLLVYVLVGFQARAEEEHLLREHGPAFTRWAGRVGRFLPGIGRWPGPTG
ncbi:MAG TPA: isoprenylcysteine carboxylmethyltransferase family protein [Deltaproteobacteria bacterium]|nr:isoprenylcysteine carboxylmethyltransferase family protein [Deltaproteobacteria bacterium]